jgi:hypothetical protein
VFIDSVVGGTFINIDGDIDSINDKAYEVINATANTFELDGVDSSSYSPYIGGGQFRLMRTVFGGMGHLEGETLSVSVDGAAHPDVVVTGGQFEIQAPAAVVHAGLKYITDVETLRIEGGSAHGTAIGKTRRINRVMMMVHRTIGIKIGTKFTQLDDVYFRNANNQMNLPPPLFTGLLTEEIDADYDLDGFIIIRQEKPLPMTLLSLSQILTEYDR